MNPGTKEEVVRSHKQGTENAVVVQLPAGRFASAIPPHFEAKVDEQGRYRIMVLVQDCDRCSFEDGEAGTVHELHLWLQLGSRNEDKIPIAGADVSLPSQQWLAMFVATDNPVVEANLRSFGFDPARLTGAELRADGGSVALQHGAHLEWFVAGHGRGPSKIGVRHAIFMPGDGPGSVPHRVVALISEGVMGQPGELSVHGASLEPFLLSGERLGALVHRMPELQADIVWRLRPEAS